MRSLSFHDWASTSLGVTPNKLGEEIDWLFREAVKDLASRAFELRSAEYLSQREPYEGRGFPEPGEDKELIAIVKETIGDWFSEQPPEQQLRELSRRLYLYMTQEN